jgi:hypothetical protein
MRDVGILIWVVFLVIGVVGSMVSSARRQLAAKPPEHRQLSFVVRQPSDSATAEVSAPRYTGEPHGLVEALQAVQARAQAPARSPGLLSARPAAPRPVAARPVAPRPVVPRAAPPRPAPRSEPPAAPEAHRARRRSPFGSGSELVRAVIAAEVLGKPRGLNDEYR